MIKQQKPTRSRPHAAQKLPLAPPGQPQALGHDAGGRALTRPCASAGMAAGATPPQLGPRARSPAHGCALRAALEFGGPRRQQGPVRRRWDAPLPSGAGRRLATAKGERSGCEGRAQRREEGGWREEKSKMLTYGSHHMVVGTESDIDNGWMRRN